MTGRQIPTGIIASAWAGRSRKCPQCDTDFVSASNRGRCPKCRHIFFAFDVYGLPTDLDLEALAKAATVVSDETSSRIMSLLTEKASELPERPETFDNPRLKDILQHEREMWDFEYQLIQDALDDGGELWWWSTSQQSLESMMGRCGLAVVKDGRVIAVMMTAMN